MNSNPNDKGTLFQGNCVGPFEGQSQVDPVVNDEFYVNNFDCLNEGSLLNLKSGASID